MLYPTQGVPGVADATSAKPVVQPARPVRPQERKVIEPEAVAPQPAVEAVTLDEVLKEVRATLNENAANLEFSIDQDTGKTIIRVIDEHTQEVIRQIPSEELIAISRSLTKLEGKLLDTVV